jgi:hypothetical protein
MQDQNYKLDMVSGICGNDCYMLSNEHVQRQEKIESS